VIPERVRVHHKKNRVEELPLHHGIESIIVHWPLLAEHGANKERGEGQKMMKLHFSQTK